MKHNISKLTHHVWLTANKVNVFSPQAISLGDMLINGKSEVVVTRIKDVKRPSADYPQQKGKLFYELEVKPC